MTDFGLIFHHLGLAVRKPENAIAFVQGLGYSVGELVFDAEQGVNLILCAHPSAPRIEIIFPGDCKSPIDALIAKHKNGIVYHCCYMTKNLDATLSALAESGLPPICISPPKTAILFGGASVSFYQIPKVGLIEIIEN